MSGVKLKILDMLKEGKISPQEALDLLQKVSEELEGNGRAHAAAGSKVHVHVHKERPGASDADSGRESAGRAGTDEAQAHASRTFGEEVERFGRTLGEEGERFGRAVEEEAERFGRAFAGEARRQSHSFTLDLGWIEDLREAVEGVAATRLERFAESVDCGGEAQTLVFEGKNAPVRLISSNVEKIEVEAQYRAKWQMDPCISLTQENGVVRLNYDDSALRSLSISVRVPVDVTMGDMYLKSKNAPVSVEGVRAGRMELCTKNDAIKVLRVHADALYCDTKNAMIALEDVGAERIELGTKNAPVKVAQTCGETLRCETGNAHIALRDVRMRKVNAETTNAHIALDNVDAQQARLFTSNAKVDVRDSAIVQLSARTTSSSLSFENMAWSGQEPLSSIDAATTNGQITVYVPQADIKCKLRASTSNGGVTSDLRDMVYQSNEKHFMEAESVGYDTAAKKLHLHLQTTNGSIYIK